MNNLKFISQKKKFLISEGDKMFIRNKEAYKKYDYSKEKLSKTILKIYKKDIIKNNTNSILEIGCSEGSRLKFLSKKLKEKKFFGIDPSKLAIKNAKKNKLNAIVGSADNLPYKNHQFEMVIFGFCLYLVDDRDLFKVLYETDRILKKGGVIIIFDFASKRIKYKTYKHNKKIKSRHMDYKKLFIHHPNYELISNINFVYQIKNNKNKSLINKERNTYLNISCILKNK
jgi:ubiquinone/menaquinone biosynthesis C-methylase UbiE